MMMKIEDPYKEVLSKEIKTFKGACDFFDFANMHGEGFGWSIQYYGFGEHFTFWAGYGTFDDFDIDKGTQIPWERMKEIIIESAESLRKQWKDWHEGKREL